MDAATADALLPPPSTIPHRLSLLLDFDGTLVDLVERPDLVRVGPDLVDLLARLSDRLEGRIALVSGRSVRDLRSLLGELTVTLSGSHGIEIDRLGGQFEQADPPEELAVVATRFDELVARAPGTLVERKPFGVAFHYRARPDLEEDAASLAYALASETGLVIQPGKMMVELRLGGVDKGHAVRALMAEPPMAGTLPCFVGDDLTDEPAFAAAIELGGSAVLVGPPRATAATHSLPDVAATLGWLRTIADGGWA